MNPVKTHTPGKRLEDVDIVICKQIQMNRMLVINGVFWVKGMSAKE